MIVPLGPYVKDGAAIILLLFLSLAIIIFFLHAALAALHA
jgi:hypothetical protein